MEPTYGDYDTDAVPGIGALRREIKRMDESDNPVKVLSDLFMNGHEGSTGYLNFGNNKIAKNTAIFNMNSATDCPNAKTQEHGESETGLCQVPWDSCYAHRDENTYNDALPKRRRQEYLWDHTDADTFAKALLHVKNRKTSDFDFLRFSESGDFRDNQDIIKLNRIAKILGDDITVYTYSASYKLDWSHAEHFTINQSYDGANYGNRLYSAIDRKDELPPNSVWCPHDKQKAEGVEPDKAIKCGECQLCINPEGPNVYIPL